MKDVKYDTQFKIGDEVIYNGRLTVIRDMQDHETYLIEASFEDYLKTGSLVEIVNENDITLFNSVKKEITSHCIESDLMESLDKIILN
jgi:hypothetical protein